jgi:hypothetical protein
MICMVPKPPSQATISDCQPLSCQAMALMRTVGTLMATVWLFSAESV